MAFPRERRSQLRPPTHQCRFALHRPALQRRSDLSTCVNPSHHFFPLDGSLGSLKADSKPNQNLGLRSRAGYGRGFLRVVDIAELRPD